MRDTILTSNAKVCKSKRLNSVWDAESSYGDTHLIIHEVEGVVPESRERACFDEISLHTHPYHRMSMELGMGTEGEPTESIHEGS
jgi:hypothetical protein